MVCQECGKEIAENCQFCPACGKKVIRLSDTDNPESQEAYKESVLLDDKGTETAKLNKTAKRVNNRTKVVIGIIAVSAVVFIISASISFFLIKPTVKLDKYLNVTFEGYESAGKAEVSFDKDGFKKEYGSKIKASEYFLITCVDGDIDKPTGLSNGDTVKFAWQCNDEEALNKYGIRLNYSDREYTVEGLKAVGSFDPFEGVEVAFDGISSEGYAVLSGKSAAKEAENLTYDIDRKEGLSNGDTITVAVSLNHNDPVQFCIENYGKAPSQLYKEYTVRGLDDKMILNTEDYPDSGFSEDYSENSEFGLQEDIEEGIIFPNSSDSIIDEERIMGLSDEDLRYAINEIYARHGYIFKDKELLAHYRGFSWYEESIKPSDFSMDLFNSVERKNMDLLQKERENRR